MRFLASGNFLCAIGVFFLPWIDVRCQMTKDDSGSVFTQSGYQIANGEATAGDLDQKIEDMLKKQGMPANQKGGAKRPKDMKEIDTKDMEKVPVLWGFVGVLGAGALLCLVLPGKLWRIGAALAMIGALAALGYQTKEGFPAANKVREAQTALKELGAGGGGMGGGGLGGAPGMGGKGMPNFGDMGYKTVYMPGFYLAWALSALPLLWILIDSAMTPRQPARRQDGDDLDDRARDDDRRNPFNDD